MILTALTLQNFRSYKKSTFAFSPTTTLLYGPNAIGKTNILEAIAMLATGKSFRAEEDREIVRWGADVASSKGTVEHTGETTQLELRVTRGEVAGVKAPIKQYLVNGIPRRQVDFAGNLRVVLFWPEHLDLVTDSPSLRRRYLDSVLVQTDREYRRNLLSYERGLRQRNKLLDLIHEGKASRSQLGFWNELLIRSGGYVTDMRSAFIEFVNRYRISKDTFSLRYDKSVISEARLEQYKAEEVAARATLVGPHRDDFAMFSDALDLSKFGSRGEQRLAVLWLKKAELAYIEQVTGSRPLLLLDDIFSELDQAHGKLVMEIVDQQQTVLTSANEDIITLVGKKGEVIRL